MAYMTKYNKFNLTCIGTHKFQAITDLCRDIPNGPVIEVGVYKGGMALHLAEIFPDRKIFLVDTFTGIPYSGPDDNIYKKGDFGDVNILDVVELFKNLPNITILQGIFPDNFRDVFDKEMFAVIHLDVDVYQAYTDGLEYLYPRTIPGGIILLDDYRSIEWHGVSGATKACDKFMQDISEEIKVHNDQYYFIKQ